MKYEKKVIGTLEKCYALSKVRVEGKERLLVAAEKHSPCFTFDISGNYIDTVWEEPGGVMTMVPVPGRDGVFLATHRFYSPNDSKEAALVCAEMTENGWKVTELCSLPFVHRFDIFTLEGRNYLLACTLKSDHEYKNDWRFPGKLWYGELKSDPSLPLELSPVFEGLGHNHGYTRCRDKGIISCDEGVFEFTPGEKPELRLLTDAPASDALKIDLDGDGLDEILTISPFHGEKTAIWHLCGEKYEKVYEHPEDMPFLHAIFGGDIYGRPTVFVGGREGERYLLAFYYENGEYRFETVDRGAGAANCMIFYDNGAPRLLAANRETDEIAIYSISR